MDPLPHLALGEFDADPSGLIEPRAPQTSHPLPSRVVMCFFHEVLAELEASGRARRIGAFSRAVGAHPIVVMEGGPGVEPVAAFHPGVGAPLAVHHFETAIAGGGRRFVACGGAGAVQPGLALGHVVVPTAAIREEGTSFHYAPLGRALDADPAAVATLTQLLHERGVPHTTGMTWTVDAIYRETRAKLARRRDEGCLTVEMEAAAFIAVARFRQVAFGQYLYAGDDVSGAAWDHRRWNRAVDARTALFELAVEAARRL